MITQSFVSNILGNTPLGWIRLVRDKLCIGDKVRLPTSEGILCSLIDNHRSVIWVDRQRKIYPDKGFQILPTRFQVYSASGVTFPLGGGLVLLDGGARSFTTQILAQ